MPWNSKYWDTIDQLYWDPIYIGMKSIPRRVWKISDETVELPKELVNLNSGIYTRHRKIGDQIQYLHNQEDILNHIFDITCSILPDSIIKELFISPLDIDDFGPFESLGREVRYRYGWGEHANVTQQDGLFISNSSYIAMELKLGAKSSPNQIAKYLALMVWEQVTQGEKENYGLLYIVPESKADILWQECGLSGPKIDKKFLNNLEIDKMPKFIRKLYAEHENVFYQVVEKMTLSVITWSQLNHNILKIMNNLDQNDFGQQTLYRLLAGFKDQIENHNLNEV